MEDQQWEYCELSLYEAKEQKRRYGREGGWSYDCRLGYYSTAGSIIMRPLAELDRLMPPNPFKKAMALLGVAGWELVSVQHGLESLYEYGGGPVRRDNTVAYFKRPVVPGRAVDEPELGALDG